MIPYEWLLRFLAFTTVIFFLVLFTGAAILASFAFLEYFAGWMT